MDTEKKPWYQSKIILLALTLVSVFGGNLLFKFVSGNITPDQLNAIQTSQPQVIEIIDRLKNGENIFSVIGSVVGVLILVFRAWFTTSTGITLK